MESPVRIGIDVGGTFTDLVAQGGDGAVAVEKVSSTPADPSVGVMEAVSAFLDAAPVGAADVEALFHGSTVTTNALLERDGATTGLLLTDGFDAVPVVGTQARPDDHVVDPFYGGQRFLVPPALTEGVPERVDSEGAVLRDLDEEAVREAVRTLRDEGVESIAVCYLFSFQNPAHEQRTRELVAEEYPECAVSLSSTVIPQIREFPRLSTTAVDAYVGPALGTYLRELRGDLTAAGVTDAQVYFMLSHGGLVPFETAADQGCRSLLSGPAAGVQAGAFFGDRVGVSDLVTMDMGGTSCDISVVVDGEVPETRETELGGYPVAVPTVDVSAIGAGGGTQARVEAGRLRVGPESAGADPGPVCYGQGGEVPTVTDANVLLGRLNPDSLLGGAIDVADGRAREAVREHLADPLGLSVTEAAAGVLELVDDEMKTEIGVRLSRQGHDPAGFALFAYGGAGPTHAARVAEKLGFRRVLVPRWPGLNSAAGLLTTDVRGEYVESDLRSFPTTSPATIEAGLATLEAEAIADRVAEGFDEARVETDRGLDLRYEGQGYELRIDLPAGDVDTGVIRERFDRAHEARYGHHSDEPLELVNYRVASRVRVPKLDPGEAVGGRAGGDSGGNGGPPTPRETRQVYDLDAREFVATPVYDRRALSDAALGGGAAPGDAPRDDAARDLAPSGDAPSGDAPSGDAPSGDAPSGDATIDGPAVIEQLDTTIVVESGQRARVDADGNVAIEVGEGVRP